MATVKERAEWETREWGIESLVSNLVDEHGMSRKDAEEQIAEVTSGETDDQVLHRAMADIYG